MYSETGQEKLQGLRPRSSGRNYSQARFVAPKDISHHIPQTSQLLRTQREKVSLCSGVSRISWPQNKRSGEPGDKKPFPGQLLRKRKAVKLHLQLCLPILRSGGKVMPALILCDHNEEKRGHLPALRPTSHKLRLQVTATDERAAKGLPSARLCRLVQPSQQSFTSVLHQPTEPVSWSGSEMVPQGSRV